MSDIVQAFDGHQITFTAYSRKGDEWMRETFGTDTVSYDPKHNRQEALEFYTHAENSGLIVSKT